MLSYPERPADRTLVGDAQELARLLPAGAIVLVMMTGVDTMQLRIVSGTEKRLGLAHITTTRTGPGDADVSRAVRALINGECKDFTGPKPVDVHCKTGRARVQAKPASLPHPASDDSPGWVSPGGYLPGGQ